MHNDEVNDAYAKVHGAYSAHTSGRAYIHNLYNVLKSYDAGVTGVLPNELAAWQLVYNVLRIGENNV